MTLLAALLMSGAVQAQEATPPACEPITREQVAALFDRWNASLQTGDPDDVARNYASDAMLLPTMSNKTRTSIPEIREYFLHFLTRQPKGEINQRRIELGCNMAYDVGTYTFTLTGVDGELDRVAARYSFIYKFDSRKGKWLISHHHSSAMPEKEGAMH